MFKIELQTGNDAFVDGNAGNYEIARILRALADELANWTSCETYTFRLKDANGNTVGDCSRTPD